MRLDPRLDGFESDLLSAVSAADLMALTAAIASEVRLSGSAEERRALTFIEEQLARAGFRTRLIEHDAYISLPGPARLEVAGLGAIECITHSFAAATPPEGLEAEVIDVGDGGAADWAYPGVRGRIALVNGLATPEQARRANLAGAAAQIFINDDHLHEMILSPVWGSPAVEQLALYPRAPAVSVRSAHGLRIRAALAGGRPVRAGIHAEVDTGWRRLPLLEAHLPGTVEANRFVLFSGHVDSWHYGAMDNGSANATMVHLGCLLAARRDSLRRGLRLCFWSGHSHGRYAGSAWYADHHWEDLRRNCVAHVNIDSVGGQGATLLTEAYCMAETFDLGREVIQRFGGQDFQGTRVGRAGDESLSGIGVPALLMTVSEQPPVEGATGAAAILGGRSGGLGWWWHTPDDTLDKLVLNFLARDARIYAATLLRLCTEKVLPFNYAAAAAELERQIAAHAEAAAGRADFSLVCQRVERLRRETDALEAALDRLRYGLSRGSPEPDRLADINAAVMDLGRATIPLNYTRAGPFEHDPALAVPPLPLLAEASRLGQAPEGSDLAKSLGITMQRRLNQVAWTLDQALAAAAAARLLVEAAIT
jgi:hypothetical protein